MAEKETNVSSAENTLKSEYIYIYFWIVYSEHFHKQISGLRHAFFHNMIILVHLVNRS